MNARDSKGRFIADPELLRKRERVLRDLRLAAEENRRERLQRRTKAYHEPIGRWWNTGAFA